MSADAPTVGDSSAERLLRRVLRVMRRATPELDGWSLRLDRAGLRAELQLDGGPLSVVVSERDGGSAYAETASLALAVQRHPADPPLSGNAERVLGTLCELLRRSDRGDLQLPGAAPERREQPSARRDPLADPSANREATAARHALEPELHWAAFLAHETLLQDDLYPHTGLWGEALEPDEIADGWCRTAARIRAERAPDKLGLYVHIPFCAQACSYCFCMRTDDYHAADLDRYLRGLLAEADTFAPLVNGLPFTSVYFGGGTPSVLPTKALRALFERLFSRFAVPADTPVIFEGNPGSLSEAKIALLAEQGRVTRLTVGVQTLDEQVQQRIARHHSPQRVAAAVRSAKRAGMAVNCDLVAGLPGQSFDSFRRDMEWLIELGPDTVHVNPFRPMPWTPFATAGGKLSQADIAERDRMMRWADDALSTHGLDSEAKSAGGRPLSADNVQEFDLRRENSSLLGLGYPAYSHAFASIYYQPRVDGELRAGLFRDMAGEHQWIGVRADDLEEQHKYLVRNFRSGISRREFRSIFGCDPLDGRQQAWRQLEQLGAVQIEGDQIYCWAKNMLETRIYRVLLYSQQVIELARRSVGSRYDPQRDYRSAMRELLGTE